MRLQITPPVVVIFQVGKDIVGRGVQDLPGYHESFLRRSIVLHLPDQEMPGIQIIPRIIGAGIIAVIIEDMERDLLLGEEDQELAVEIHLPHHIKGFNILHGDRALVPLRIMEQQRIVLPLKLTAVEDVVLSAHQSSSALSPQTQRSLRQTSFNRMNRDQT